MEGRFVKWTRRIGPDFVAGQDFPVFPWLLFVDVARLAEVKAGAARPHPAGAWP
jgi:hypothetical protein